jgi:DNA-binding MarR family transcriptional regulator
MQRVGDILEKNTIVVLNEALKHGFAQIPRYVLQDKRLSFGARLTYAVLLSYAWQEGSCFPGQDRMAKDLGVSRQMVNEYLNELKDKKYIGWSRRGLGKTNIYYILDFKPLNFEADVK